MMKSLKNELTKTVPSQKSKIIFSTKKFIIKKERKETNTAKSIIYIGRWLSSQKLSIKWVERMEPKTKNKNGNGRKCCY